MSLICLTYQGLSDRLAVSILWSFVWRLSPSLVFLSETKLAGVEMAVVKKQFDDDDGVYVDSRGRAGELALLWRTHLSLPYLIIF